jgi:hypothetical protein
MWSMNEKFSNLIPSGEKVAEGIQDRKFVCRFRVMETSEILAVRDSRLRRWLRAFETGNVPKGLRE